MNYFVKKRLNSICSDTSDNSLDDSYESSRPVESDDDFLTDIEDVGVTVDIDIVDGRLDHPKSRTILRVKPVDEDGELVCVRLQTNHHAFSRGGSITIRSFHRFYSLQRLLREQHPYITTPSLPARPFLLFISDQRKLEILSEFLSAVLRERQYLSNKALHLFLQTSLSWEKIIMNMEGIRDDQVNKEEETRKKNITGIRQIFGDQDSCHNSHKQAVCSKWNIYVKAMLFDTAPGTTF